MDWPRILKSSKFQAAAVATAVLTVALVFTVRSPSGTRAEKQAAIEHYIYAVAGAWGLAIGGTALEDYGAKRDAPDRPAAPVVQVNSGEGQANTQQSPPPACLPGRPKAGPYDGGGRLLSAGRPPPPPTIGNVTVDGAWPIAGLQTPANPSGLSDVNP